MHETRGELGAAVNWKPADRYGLTAGLKVERSGLEAEGDRAADPHPDLCEAAGCCSPPRRTRTPSSGCGWSTRSGRSTSGNFTAASEYATATVRVGNPDLRPQRDWVAEGVVERRFWTTGSLVLTGRYYRLVDVVDVLPLAVPGGIASGGGQYRRRGPDRPGRRPHRALKPIGLDGIMLRGGVNWRRARVTDPTTDERRRLSNQSTLLAEAHFSHDLPRWKLTGG